MSWNGRKLLITGASGTLGQALARLCEERALPFCLTARDELDITRPESIDVAIERHEPWAVINTAGFVRVADAENERPACFAWNAAGAANLAEACAAAGIPLVTFSSDLVFDGCKGSPYLEDDPVSPAGAYGESKAEAERRVLAAHPGALVIRTAAFFGPWDRYNFAWAVVNQLAEGRRFAACPNSFVSPTFVPDLGHATLDLLTDGEQGLWHLANVGCVSWYEFALCLAEAVGLDASLIDAVPAVEARRDTSLASRHGRLLRPLDQAIADYAAAMRDAIDLPAAVAAE